MVKNGIDCVDKYDRVFRNKRLGMITSISGVDSKLHSSIEILHKKYGLKVLFAPEHGVRGNVGAGGMVEDYVDELTGLPVKSLYRKDSKRLTQEMLDEVDAVIYDIQDLGVRYYTFITTMMYALEDCAARKKELIILDRFNPLGDTVEGNCLKAGYESFVGAYTVCMRYGLTVGELAAMINNERKIGCELIVIPCEGWNRNMLFPDTGNVWVMPSLGVPRFETALLYSGICLFEGTNISEGRGTTAPFEVIGAPFINAGQLVQAMEKKKLPGVLYSPAYFTPSFSKFSGEECRGIHIHITDRKLYRAAQTGLELLLTIRDMYGEQFAFLEPQPGGKRRFIELLFGSDRLSEASCTREELLMEFEQDAESFCGRKRAYHLY